MPLLPMAFDSIGGTSTADFIGDDGTHAFPAFAATAGQSSARLVMTGVSAELSFDDLAGQSDAAPMVLTGDRAMVFDSMDGVSDGPGLFVPDLSDNPPIYAAVVLYGDLLLIPPPPP